jgi:hypothetical protein
MLGNTWVAVSSLESKGLQPPFPNNIRVAYKIYWDLQEAFSVVGQQNFQREIDYTTGSVVTDSTTFSAELGVKIGDLSAKLSQTMAHSVSISTQSTDKQTFGYQIPQGSVSIIAFWQLVELYALVDLDGLALTYNGRYSVFNARVPVSFPASTLVNRTPHIVADRTDFQA